jgi:glycosyltransferase involved in cell wall biosynthesis
VSNRFDFVELAYEYPLYYPPPKSENYFLYPVLIAKKMNMKPAIFTLRTSHTPLRRELVDDISVFRFDSIFPLLRQLVRQSPELVHCHSLGWIPAHSAPLFSRRSVFTPHTYRLDIYPKWKVKLALLPVTKSNAIVTRTEFEAQQFRSIMQAPSIHVIPIPIDYDFFTQPRREWRNEIFSRYGLSDEDRVVLCVANLRPVKNLSTLIRSFALVKARVSSSKLIIVGDDPASTLSMLRPTKPKTSHRLELTKLASALGLKNDVVFAGFKSEEELRKFYAASEVFCMPSRIEGQLLAAGEAASAGIPLVLSNLGTLTEIYRCCALFHDPMDCNKLAEHVVRLLENQKLAKTLANAGRVKMQNYRPSIIYRRQKELYEKLLS